ncbi:MAG: tRNA 2-thiouridine(34) synthase MnmA [Planctomycetota bacterium]|nr:tRNA 2-thiouridine(34) synthase MnmA [Planctomycetota bacterium]
MSRGKVLVAMSGGVDSSVAAALLARDGWEVVGAFMRLGSIGDGLDIPVEAVPSQERRTVSLKIAHRGCCSIEDAHDARAVAAQLDIPFYVLNFKKDFSRVIDLFVDEYAAGRTPNPCVRCNDWLKFGRLRDHAEQIGATHIASGHYAQSIEIDGASALLRGVDHSKDQSYVLFGTPRDQLAHTLYPVGGLPKAQVRQLAHDFGLNVGDKPDSQEICFVPDDDYASLVNRLRPHSVCSGHIVHTDGRILGEHQGQHHFTVGQRRGIRISDSEPLYVISKNATTNVVTVGKRAALFSDGCTASLTNWLIDPPSDWMRCEARIRYNAPLALSHVRAGNGSLEVRFDTPQRAVSPGQAVVLYSADRVLGGGWIDAAVTDGVHFQPPKDH